MIGFPRKSIAEVKLNQEASVLVLATRQPDSKFFDYRPNPSVVLPAGTVIVIMGEVGNIVKARKLAGMVSGINIADNNSGDSK